MKEGTLFIKMEIERAFPELEVKSFSKEVNGVIREGLQLKRHGARIAPVVYFDTLPEDITQLLTYVKETLWEVEKIQYPIWITNFEEAKEYLLLQVVKEEKNGWLKEVPHKLVEDLALYPVLQHGNESVTVTNFLLERWGISEETVFAVAKENTKEAAEVMTLSSLLPFPMPDMDPEDDFLFVATNKWGKKGAAVAFLPELLKGISERFKDDVLIIPSSIHECLYFPASIADTEVIAKMIPDINQEHVTVQERLSDHPYFYHRKTGKVTMQYAG